MVKPKKKMMGGARKVVSAVASAALVLGLTPAAAFAAPTVNENDKVVYTLPTQPMQVQWQGTDANGQPYTYENLTVCLASPPMQRSYYSLLGISNSALGRTIVAGGATETEYDLSA